MPTTNKRVAAYLPEALAAKFEAYKVENNLGDSSALIAILSQFLGVTHSVAQSNSDYFDILDKKISQLKYDLKSELLSELLPELLLFRKSPSKLPSESPSKLLGKPLSESPLPIVGAELSSLELKEYLKINSSSKNLKRDVSRAAARLGQKWESLGAQVWHRIQ
jgi:hypothetical protein